MRAISALNGLTGSAGLFASSSASSSFSCCISANCDCRSMSSGMPI